MAIYELRTYTVTVGKMSDVVALYKAEGWPALSKHPAKLCGYFTGDIGALKLEISAYQANIRTASHDMLLLYSGSRDIEVGPLLLKLQHIF